MTLLDRLRNAIQLAEKPSGDPAEFARMRSEAYRKLFGVEPDRVLPHKLFQKPANMGGSIDVHLYKVILNGEAVDVAVTSGMSDYQMKSSADPTLRRRELIQYFRAASGLDVGRLHDLAWLPLAQGYCLDYFETVGPHTGITGDLPNSLFLQPIVREHGEFRLKLGGDEMQLLWHVPLTERELEFKLGHGVNELLSRMQERAFPWIFDPADRPSLV